jgi:hypothetical protein
MESVDQAEWSLHVDDNISASFTYSIDWEGCDSSEAWFRAKFHQAAEADQLSPVPDLSRADGTWCFILRKEANSFRWIIPEQTESGILKDTPEQSGLLVLTLYEPYQGTSTIKDAQNSRSVCRQENGPELERSVCLLSSPQLGFFLQLLLRNPPVGTGNTLSSLPLIARFFLIFSPCSRNTC